MKNSDLLRRIRLAQKVAVQAGTLQLKELHRLDLSSVRTKSQNNFVTHVDLASEKIILSAIHRAFPDDAVLSEEAGAIAGSHISWVIDPLDGTSNFIHKIPFFGVSIAVQVDREVVGGVLYVPSRREMFWAQKGNGTYLNNRRVTVSNRRFPNESLIGTAIPYKSLHKRWNEYEKKLTLFSRAGADMRRSGAMAVDLAYLACGRIDGLCAFDQAAWDLAAGELLVREAGGVILTPDPKRHPHDRLCANPRLMASLRKLLKV